MTRRGLAALTALLVALTVAAGACGDDEGDEAAEETLPPIATTTTTTTTVVTTTTWVPVTYVIQPGDSLQSIANQFGVDMNKLAILNGITNHDRIEAGDTLDIPPPTSSTTTTSTTSTTAGTAPSTS